ncbi:hypothetical protein CRM22_001393 [Opisthorchis felineus]|uniref:C3H1-type domain-containing protein n=1 Tax=Opisthorchis felineus TaxID=147828 RepID=A0A4S2MB39_OPIFE|nr:hypothetical protein CRM22_001393 [Opisthorchis felineus]
MLHSPLTGSSQPPYRPPSVASLDGPGHPYTDQKALQPSIPAFLQHVLPLQTLQSRASLGNIPQSLSNGFHGFSPSLVVGSLDGTNSLSGSSSLSSSLISLHSAPRVCSLPNGNTNTPCQLLPSPLGQQLNSTSRCSLWLKLRVCPSWAPQAPPILSDPTSDHQVTVTTTSPAVHGTSTGGISLPISAGSKDPSAVRPIQCPLYSETCPYAHPSSNVRIEAGHVTVCYDFIKRKNCTHSCCKYYHPPPHQIEAIVKRGDEQKKILESQQRLFEAKSSTATATCLTMQPTQPVTGPGGLSSGFVWSSTSPFQPAIPASVLGSYLTPGGPALPTALNPMAALGTPFVSVSDPNSLSTSALLAAAAALQQQQASNLSSLATQSSAVKTSTAGSGAVANCRSTPLPSSFSNGSHLSVTSTSEILSALQSQLLLLHHQQQHQQQEQRQVVGVSTHNTSHPSDLMVTMNAVSLPPSSNLAVGSVTTTTTTAQSSTMSLNTTTTPLDVSSSSLAISAPATVSSVVRVGMKREASSHSASGDGVNGLDLHSRYPAKRPNQNSSYAAGSVPESESSDGASSLCNGTCPSTGPTEQQRTDVEFFKSTADISVPFTHGLALSSAYCGALPTPQLTTSGVSGLLTSTNLYGLPFPTAQAVASSYLPAQPLAYSPVYPTQGTPDNPNSAAALALNSWLTQQQQQQQHNSALHQLQTQVHVTQTNPANPALAAALAAIQQQQQQQRQSPHELSTSSPSPVTFQQQQQQQALLSLFLRAQQSQLAAAQMAAALQGGFVHASPGHRPPAFPGACFFDSTYSFPGSLTGIPGNPYASAVPCLQNPITNVAYINDKGHLLETLPICRDFKAGKCHRNSDCRYVHLVDENVEVNQGRVIVCRDAAKGRCTRVPCKYYHVPLLAISANRSLALNSALATAGFPTA